MLTLREQEDRVAALLKVPPMAVLHVARKLRPPLWPSPGKGRRGGLATPRQFSTLAAAAATARAGGSAIAAAERASKLVALPLVGTQVRARRADGTELPETRFFRPGEHVAGLPLGATAGDTLAGYIEHLAERRSFSAIRSLVVELILHDPGHFVCIRIEEALPLEQILPAEPKAELCKPRIIGRRYEIQFYVDADQPTRDELKVWWPTVVLTSDLFSGLADIWLQAGDAAPQRETPTPFAGGPASTLVKDRSRNGETRTEALPTLDPTRALFLSQAYASPPGGLPVPIHKGNDPLCPTTAPMP